MRLAVMVHEMFMPANSPANALMSICQRWQFAAVTSTADLTLFSTGPWHDRYRRRHPGRRSLHMPVGSNLSVVPADRDEMRAELKLPAGAVVLGTFGGHHPSRLLNWLAEAAGRLKTCGFDVRILSIGPAGTAVRSWMSSLPVIDLGPLAADQVSRYFRAIDIYCCPFIDGVSTRRGSFFAGIQHGLAVVTTDGYHTDQGLRQLHGDAIFAVPATQPAAYMEAVLRLARQPELRQAMGQRARHAFDSNYALPVLARKWRAAIDITADDRIEAAASNAGGKI
jgi:glycosyltransferase involved in cell wall biosynthesis